MFIFLYLFLLSKNIYSRESMIDHLEIMSTVFHKDSKEAKNQSGASPSCKNQNIFSREINNFCQCQSLRLSQRRRQFSRRRGTIKILMTMRQMTTRRDSIPKSKIRDHEKTPTPLTSATVENRERISFLLLKEQLRQKLVWRNLLKFRLTHRVNLSTATL